MLFEGDSRIKYWSQENPHLRNFGDFLSSLFVNSLLTTPRIEADVYHLVGSVIDDNIVKAELREVNGFAKGGIAFWGCGKRDSNSNSAELLRSATFCGVRGPLTRDALGLAPDTVLGDTGLLAPLCHTPALNQLTRGRTIGIPHIFDTQNKEQLRKMSGVDLIVSPAVKPTEAALREILDKISSASFVLTGSLHGAVIASAYGIPFAFWDSGYVDTPFKWSDFAASIGIPCNFARDLQEAFEIYNDTIKPSLALPKLTPLLEVCPFSIRPASLIKALCLDNNLECSELSVVQAKLQHMNIYSSGTVQLDTEKAREARARKLSLGYGLLSRSGRQLMRVESRIEQLKVFLRAMFREPRKSQVVASHSGKV